MTTKEKLLAEVNRLIKVTADVIAHNLKAGKQNEAEHVSTTDFAFIRASCLNLMRVIGKPADIWKDAFEKGKITILMVLSQWHGTLIAVRQAIESDLLLTVDKLVLAEAFDDLLEQADHLLDKGFFVAAGVLGRAVLEEHLRKWCDHAGCKPTEPRPTIEHFKQRLYADQHMDKLEMKHVEDLAAVGNECAHNTGKASTADVERLLRDVRAFLRDHPLR